MSVAGQRGGPGQEIIQRYGARFCACGLPRPTTAMMCALEQISRAGRGLPEDPQHAPLRSPTCSTSSPSGTLSRRSRPAAGQVAVARPRSSTPRCPRLRGLRIPPGVSPCGGLAPRTSALYFDILKDRLYTPGRAARQRADDPPRNCPRPAQAWPPLRASLPRRPGSSCPGSKGESVSPRGCRTEPTRDEALMARYESSSRCAR